MSRIRNSHAIKQLLPHAPASSTKIAEVTNVVGTSISVEPDERLKMDHVVDEKRQSHQHHPPSGMKNKLSPSKDSSFVTSFGTSPIDKARKKRRV